MTNGEAVIAELISEVASLRAQLTEEAAKHALTIQHSDLLGARLASARKVLERIASMMDEEDEWDGRDKFHYAREFAKAALT